MRFFFKWVYWHFILTFTSVLILLKMYFLQEATENPITRSSGKVTLPHRVHSLSLLSCFISWAVLHFSSSWMNGSWRQRDGSDHGVVHTLLRFLWSIRRSMPSYSQTVIRYFDFSGKIKIDELSAEVRTLHNYIMEVNMHCTIANTGSLEVIFCLCSKRRTSF